MNIRKAMVRGTIAMAVGAPLALQLMMPAAASASRTWGPIIIAASPTAGPTRGGTTVTITGDDLTMVTGVLFGTVPASYTIVSNGEIIATAPAEATGAACGNDADGQSSRRGGRGRRAGAASRAARGLGGRPRRDDRHVERARRSRLPRRRTFSRPRVPFVALGSQQATGRRTRCVDWHRCERDPVRPGDRRRPPHRNRRARVPHAAQEDAA